MSKIFRSLLVASSFAIFGGIAAHATDNTNQNKRHIETEIPQRVKAINAGFSTDSNISAAERRVNISVIAEDLKYDGTGFGWIDEDGTPLEVTSQNDEILFKRIDGRVSRLKMTDMSGVIEPQIGTSAVTVSASTMTK